MIRRRFLVCWGVQGWSLDRRLICSIRRADERERSELSTMEVSNGSLGSVTVSKYPKSVSVIPRRLSTVGTRLLLETRGRYSGFISVLSISMELLMKEAVIVIHSADEREMSGTFRQKS